MNIMSQLTINFKQDTVLSKALSSGTHSDYWGIKCDGPEKDRSLEGFLGLLSVKI